MKKRFGVILTILVLVLLIYILKDIDFIEVYNLLKGINYFWFGLAVLSSLSSFLIWNLRFMHSLGGIVKGEYGFLLKVLFAGIFVNTITPGTGIGGEPVRAYFLNKKYKKPKARFLGGILADKFFNLLVFLVFVIFSVLFVLFFVKIPSNLKVLFEIVLISILILIGGIIVFVWKKKRFDINWISRKLYSLKLVAKHFKNLKECESYLYKKINTFLITFKKIVSDKKKIYLGIFLSFGLWFAIYFTSYFLFLSLGLKVNFLLVMVVVTLGYLVGDLSPIPGGIGLMESSMFLLYSATGIAAPLAIVVALLSRMIYYFFSLFIGGISLLYLKFSVK